MRWTTVRPRRRGRSCSTVNRRSTSSVKWTTAMRSLRPKLCRMLSAASRAIATRLPLDMEPDASSTRVTLRGTLSTISGAWKARRARCLSPVQRVWQNVGGYGEAVVVGQSVLVIKGVDPFLGPNRRRVHLVPGTGPVQGQLERGAVGIEAKGRNGVIQSFDEILTRVSP